MKIKLMIVLAFALAIVGLVPGKAFAADPASFLALGATESVSSGGTNPCQMTLKYFTFGTVAVAQMVHGAGTLTCTGTSFVEVVALMEDGVTWKGQRCYITPDATHQNGTDGLCSSFPASGGGTVYQAYIPDSDVVGVRLGLCSLGNTCNNEIRRTFDTAFPDYFESVVPEGTGCEVEYQHGDYSTTGLARLLYDSGTGSCDVLNNVSYIEVRAVDNATGVVKTQRCYMNGTGSGQGLCSIYDAGGSEDWYQAYIPTAHVLNATAHLCDDNLEEPCKDYFFSGF